MVTAKKMTRIEQEEFHDFRHDVDIMRDAIARFREKAPRLNRQGQIVSPRGKVLSADEARTVCMTFINHLKLLRRQEVHLLHTGHDVEILAAGYQDAYDSAQHAALVLCDRMHKAGSNTMRNLPHFMYASFVAFEQLMELEMNYHFVRSREYSSLRSTIQQRLVLLGELGLALGVYNSMRIEGIGSPSKLVRAQSVMSDDIGSLKRRYNALESLVRPLHELYDEYTEKIERIFTSIDELDMFRMKRPGFFARVFLGRKERATGVMTGQDIQRVITLDSMLKNISDVTATAIDERQSRVDSELERLHDAEQKLARNFIWLSDEVARFEQDAVRLKAS